MDERKQHYEKQVERSIKAAQWRLEHIRGLRHLKAEPWLLAAHFKALFAEISTAEGWLDDLIAETER